MVKQNFLKKPDVNALNMCCSIHMKIRQKKIFIYNNMYQQLISITTLKQITGNTQRDRKDEVAPIDEKNERESFEII